MSGIVTRWPRYLGVAVVAAVIAWSGTARADDPLLDEVVDFTATILYVESGVPAVILGAVRDGETAVVGIGDADGNGMEPDGDTIMRVSSVTKAFTGQVLADMVADGTVQFTDRLQDLIGWDVTVPSADGHDIRLIDLVTHSSGLPREVEVPPDADDAAIQESYIAALNDGALLYPPGTGALYSNVAFDLLGIALANAAGQPYDALLKERVLDPIGLEDSFIFLPEAERDRLMLGKNFDGQPFPDSPSLLTDASSGSLYSTTNDILKFLSWHLDRFDTEDAEVRLLDHATYLQRDGLNPVYGLDESGRMDAMGLGWVVMMPEGNRPMLLQKAGGGRGIFVYAAFAPTRGVGAFVAINEFDFATAMNMATVVNDMIATLAPR